MIEQTELIVKEWNYYPPSTSTEDEEELIASISLDVMKKRVLTKKGIACRFSCRYTISDITILDYVAEDSYVIDLDDVIDKNELRTMIRNSYEKFNEKFNLRKFGTILQNKTLKPLDETLINFDAMLPLLET